MPGLPRIKEKLFYGWVVVTACLVIGTIIFGIRYSFGVFLKPIGGEFTLTRAATSGIFSAYMVLCGAFEILGGWTLDRYGPRIVTLLMGLFTGLSLLLTSRANSSWQLFVTYSLLLAVGTGAAYTVLMATSSRWFDKKRGLALGIAGSGAGLGTLVMAPFASHLIASFGWRTAYIEMGSIAGVVIVCLSMLLRKSPRGIGALPNGTKVASGETVVPNEEVPDKKHDAQAAGFSLLQASRTRSFYLFGGIWLLWALSLHLVMTHIVAHQTDLGIPATEAAVVLGLIGGTSILGRLIMGGVSDRIGRKVSAVICALLQAGTMVWLVWSHDLWMFYLFAVIYGFGYGGLDPPTVALIGDTFGLRSLGIIMATLHVGWGVGAAIGPVVGGLIFDATNSYTMAFLTGMLAMLVTALLVVLSKQEGSESIRTDLRKG